MVFTKEELQQSSANGSQSRGVKHSPLDKVKLRFAERNEFQKCLVEYKLRIINLCMGFF